MKYICPFCYKTMPEGYEPSGWQCCGEVGHATILPECPKCGAESLELPLAHCVVCGWKSDEYLRRRDCLPRTPRTDAVIEGRCKVLGTQANDLLKMEEHARQLERELYAALIAAGVASLERGEWAVERDTLRDQAIEECAKLVEEYNDQSETGDTLTMLAENMRAKARRPYAKDSADA